MSRKRHSDSSGDGALDKQQKSSLSKGDESMETISRQDLKLVKEMFPDIDDDIIRKRFSDLLKRHENNILERLIESILKTQEFSSPSLETSQSTHDIQAALGNPRPNLQRQETGSSTASGHSEDLRPKCVRGLKWRKGSSASSDKGKGLASKSQQVSSPDSGVNMTKGEETNESQKPQFITCKDLSKIHLHQHMLEKWCHMPFFKETVCGCFVRIATGNEEMAYGIAEIVGTVKFAEIYQLGTTHTNKGVKLKRGHWERDFLMVSISNQDFTDSEFSLWQAAMMCSDSPIPTIQEVDRKQKAIQEAMNFKFNESDIEKGSSSPSLETSQSTHDIQAALGNPRPNLQRQEFGSCTASGHSKELRRKCIRGLKWRKGTSASSNKGKGLAKKSQQVSYPDSDVTMMDIDDNNVSHSNDDAVVPMIENHPFSISEVSSSRRKCDGCGTSHDTITISQCCDAHLVCKACVEKQVKRVISTDSQETQISCPANGCKTYIPESQASKVLPSFIMELLEEKRNKIAMESITKMDDLHSCPFCEFPVAVDHGIQKFLCPNPNCQKLSCRYCKRIWLNIDHTSCTAFMTLSEESKEHLELPRYWHPIPEEQKDFILVELDTNGREFTLIKDQFRASMKKIVPISIRRIQNPRLWQKFSLARKHMSEDFGPNLINEQQLFHGTKVEAIEAICRDGLDWRMCGVNGVRYGQGTYFARKANYSDKYCVPYSGQQGNPSQPSGSTSGNVVVIRPSGSTSGNTVVTRPVVHFSVFGPTGQGTLNLPPLLGNTPNPSGSQNQFNTLGGIGTQTGFGTVTFGTPFGPEKSSQTTGCDSTASNGKIPQVTSDVKQMLQVQHKYMFVARVLVGRPGQGREGMRKPPEDPSDPKGRAFNSCVDFVDRPSIFVIFDSTQCYPEYLIEYIHLK